MTKISKFGAKALALFLFVSIYIVTPMLSLAMLNPAMASNDKKSMSATEQAAIETLGKQLPSATFLFIYLATTETIFTSDQYMRVDHTKVNQITTTAKPMHGVKTMQ